MKPISGWRCLFNQTLFQMLVLWLVLIISSVAALFFSGAEAAFSHTDKLYFEVSGSQNDRSGKLLSQLMERMTGVSAILLGYFLVSLAFCGWAIQKLMPDFPVFGFVFPSWLATGLLFFTLAFSLVVFSRFLFLSFPLLILRWLALPLYGFYRIGFPVFYLLTLAPFRILEKIQKFTFPPDKNAFKFAGLGFYFQYEHGTDENDWEEVQTDAGVDNKIFNNALTFREVRVKECMIPRTEITAVSLKENIEAVKKAAMDSGHSKILIYRESLEDIRGYCHILELFKKPESIADIITPILSVPETMLVSELLEKFNAEHRSIALVTDEFGGTAGLITREDVVEVIFGEIQDEYDQSEDWVEIQVSPSIYLLSARHEIHYLNEKYGWDLPEGDYETLGGLIMANYGTLPPLKTIVKVPPFTFEVLSAKGAKMETVQLTLQG
jgi:putative hemolysin